MTPAVAAWGGHSWPLVLDSETDVVPLLLARFAETTRDSVERIWLCHLLFSTGDPRLETWVAERRPEDYLAFERWWAQSLHFAHGDPMIQPTEEDFALESAKGLAAHREWYQKIRERRGLT